MTSTTTPSAEAATSDPVTGEPLAGFALRAVPLAAAGWLLGGWVGLAAAAVGVASTFRRPPTLVALAAPVALVVAALATVIEVPVDGDALRSSFADDRPTAATAGLVAALFALTAVVTLAVRDRAPLPVPADEAAGSDSARLDRAAVTARVTEWAPLAGIVLAAALALAVLAPGLPAATDEVAANVRLGRGWGTTEEGVVVVDGTEPPLAVVVGAVAPGGARAWTALAGSGAALAAAVFVARRAGRRAVLLAAAATALGLVVVRADLAGALAAVFVGAALLAGDPDGRTPLSAALAGAAYGAAVLAFPVLGLALPLVVAALAVDPRTRAVTVGHGVAGLAGAVVVVAPWQRWLVERFSTWSPAAEVTVPPSSLLAVLVILAVVLLAPQTTAQADPT
ncbi:MAG TPA: hypothetical protein VF228_09700 [Iamia sp.]